jgi:Predicted transcriptional regulators
MKFSEKLQYLRKESKLSQEAFADMLEVSRQAVSKWESGQTYPEMDKLISICKIFNCSLDELTNDEIKEIKTNSTDKNTNYGIVNDLLELISKTFKMFNSMSFKETVNCILFMLMIFILILLVHIPVERIYDLGNNIFSNFGKTGYEVISSIWYFILEIAYLVFAVMLFVYIYKIKFLDNFTEVKESNNIKNVEEKKNFEEKKEVKKHEVYVEKASNINNNRSFSLFRALGVIFLVLLKLIVIMMAFPFLMILCVSFVALVIWFLAVFKGLVYIGLFLLLVAVIIIDILVLNVIYQFLTNKPIFIKKLFAIIIVSGALLGIGTGLTMVDFASISYYDSAPKDAKVIIKEQDFEFTDDLLILGYDFCYDCERGTKLIVDESLGNKVRVVVKTYEEGIDNDIDLIQNAEGIIYFSYNKRDINIMKYFDMLISDLKKKKTYDYSKLNGYEMFVYGSKENLAELEKRRRDYYIMTEETERQQIINELYDEISSCEKMIRDLENEINLFSEERYTYENKIIELESKITEYQDKIKSLME